MDVKVTKVDGEENPRISNGNGLSHHENHNHSSNNTVIHTNGNNHTTNGHVNGQTEELNGQDVTDRDRNKEMTHLGSQDSEAKKQLFNSKYNFQNVEHFIKLNGQEREVTWEEDEDDIIQNGDNHHSNSNSHNETMNMKIKMKSNNPAVSVTAKEIQDAVKEAEKMCERNGHGNEDTAGIIIFKDQNGVAPPLTMTILKSSKNNNGTAAVAAAEQHFNMKNTQQNHNNNKQNDSRDVQISLESPEPAEEPDHENEVKTLHDQTFTSSASTLTLEEGDVVMMNGHHHHHQHQQQQQQIQHRNNNGFMQIDQLDIGSLKMSGKDTEMEAMQQAEKPSLFGFDGGFRKQLKSVVQRKKDDQKTQFEALRSTYKLGRDAQNILALDWDTLVGQLQSRQLTAVEVLSAFIAKSLEATSTCNAITEYNPKAMEIAKVLDQMPKVKGPFHGVPFCVKDDTNLEGMDSTLGFAKNCYQPAEKSAALVLTLEHLGGVPFCKTNVPQTLLSFGSDNPVFGQTTSCHNTKLGPGGSSSGTGALVGSLGTFFGTGTDIGGSLRLPAHCNGVASLKPTAGRLSSRGVAACLPNIMGLDATSGIIGQNAKIVSSVYKGILKDCLQTKFDPRVLPIPWDQQTYESKKKLRIGYITQSSFYPPVGDTIATVEKAVEALKSQGHTLIPMELPDGSRIMRCAANFILADDQKAVARLLKGEEVAKCAELNALSLKVPHWTMKLFSYLMNRKTLLPFLYSKSLSSMLDAGSFKSDQLWDNTSEKKKLQEEILQDWMKSELDCCVLPVMPFPAVPLNLPGLLPVAAVYTMAWNVVDFPAGVIKFGTESGKNIESYDWQGDQALKLGKQACMESIGSPIGVQVVALPFKEELVLRVMEQLDDYATENKFFA